MRTLLYISFFFTSMLQCCFSQTPEEQEVLINQNRLDERIYNNSTVDQKAVFKRGEKDLYEYYTTNSRFKVTNIKIPENSVYFNLFIDEKGNVYDFKIIKSFNTEYNQEVERIIKQMPCWQPAVHNGEKVKVSLVEYISFKRGN